MDDQIQINPLEQEQREGGSAQTADPTELIKFLIKDESIPTGLDKIDYWGLASQESALTRLDRSDINTLRIMADIVSLTARMAKPAHKFTFSDLANQTNMDAKIFVKLCRSWDGYERAMIATQIRQYVTKSLTPQPKQNKIFGALGKLFGGGNKQQ